MTPVQIKELVKRAAWTFVQAFLATFVTLAPGILDAPNLVEARALIVSAIVASLGAAFSAVKTFAIVYRR